MVATGKPMKTPLEMDAATAVDKAFMTLAATVRLSVLITAVTDTEPAARASEISSALMMPPTAETMFVL